MKFKQQEEVGRRVSFSVELSEYDSPPPSDKLLLDAIPEGIDPNRLAIALFLIFGEWSGGEFMLPHAISPHTAETMMEAAKPIRLVTGPYEFYPKGLPIGTRRIICTDDATKLPDDNTIVLLEADNWSGVLRSYSSLAVSSNAFVFQEDDSHVAPLIGVSVLFADSLNADIIVADRPVPKKEAQRIDALLSCVRLGFEVETY